ncbi:MAG: septal ring lytic transglycosylase RlpA family protein [Bacteroidota bacterium]|nr:septal ring lytic transglycosylase RlpA family protein [Bacteroidota bacterium]MDQ6888692.1 septal ring lytic transglycosylase RlpA family protein [Bacteroidota bacterium]
MKIFLSAFLFLTIFFTEASAQKKSKPRHSTAAKKPVIKYGTASFYAAKFEKRQTASGEIYRSKKYSAACNVLPLHTWIKVTNLRNDKSVIVKINDRLHSKNKRLVDLSRIAAKELGFISKGLIRVKIEVLNNFHLVSEK